MGREFQDCKRLSGRVPRFTQRRRWYSLAVRWWSANSARFDARDGRRYAFWRHRGLCRAPQRQSDPEPRVRVVHSKWLETVLPATPAYCAQGFRASTPASVSDASLRRQPRFPRDESMMHCGTLSAIVRKGIAMPTVSQACAMGGRKSGRRSGKIHLARTHFAPQANRDRQPRSAEERLLPELERGIFEFQRTAGRPCNCLMAQPRLLKVHGEKTNPNWSSRGKRPGFANLKKRTQLEQRRPGRGFADERTNPTRRERRRRAASFNEKRTQTDSYTAAVAALLAK
jgi:hypothetical protein